MYKKRHAKPTKRKKFIIRFFFFLFVLLFVFYHFYSDSLKDCYIYSDNETKIYPQISGKISEINVEKNSSVKKGEILAKIDSKDIEKKLKEKEDELEAIRKELQDSKKETEKSENNILSKKNDIKKAKLDLENANSDYIRYKNAYQDGSVTKKDINNALKNLEIARKNYKNAQNMLEISKNYAEIENNKKSIKNSKIKKLEAQVDSLKLDLLNTTIISPVDGIVISKAINKNSFADSKNQKPIFIISPNYYVAGNFKNKFANMISVGTKVTITDSKTKKKYKGIVVSAFSGKKMCVKAPCSDVIIEFDENIAEADFTNSKVKVKVNLK